MYGYEWTEEYGIFRLTINARIKKEIRPVFHEELDFFGMDAYWDYPKDTDAPLLWAEGVRRYVMNGVYVAEAQGGGFYTKPVINRLTEERLQLRPIDTDRLYEVNKALMLSLEQKAIAFIQEQHEHYASEGFAFVCAFSGGKDSLVLLDLCAKALAPEDFYVVFSNTGMELSDTLKAVEEAKKRWPQLRFEEAKCHMSATESWAEFGPPASRLRWCCSVHKSVPTILLIKEIFGEQAKAVVFDGVRAEESSRRSKYTEVGEGVKNAMQINCHAILKWSSAEVFVYSLKNGVILNKAYRYGIYRVGCMVCPMAAKWQDTLIAHIYPAEIKHSLGVLEEVTLHAKGKLDKKYIEDGGWQARVGGSILDRGENRVVEKSIYLGLKDMTYDTTIGQFDNALKTQTARISMARNRVLLLNKWTTLTGEESVKSWCVAHKAPILWIVPKEHVKAIETVIEVQQNVRIMDQKVVSALQMLDTLDVGLMTDDQRIEAALINTIGMEYKEIWRAERDNLISKARMKNGADMSTWTVNELISFQRMLKDAQQEKAKKEKLAATKTSVQNMAETKLRSRIAAFLDQHPEFCDSFME